MLAPTATTSSDDLLVTLAEMGVYAALDTIGRRLTRTLPRAQRYHGSRVRQTDTTERHTLIPVDPAGLPQLTAGVYRHFDRAAGSDSCLRTALSRYVERLVLEQLPHTRNQLELAIRETGCIGTA